MARRRTRVVGRAPTLFLFILNNPLVEHRVGDFYESCDIGPNYEIAGLSVLFRGIPGDLKNCGHDVAQPRIHLFAWPLQHVHLPGLAGKVDYAQLLNDASEIGLVTLPPGAQASTIHPGGQPEGTLTLKLPIQRPDVAVPVVELFLAPGT